MIRILKIGWVSKLILITGAVIVAGLIAAALVQVIELAKENRHLRAMPAYISVPAPTPLAPTVPPLPLNPTEPVVMEPSPSEQSRTHIVAESPQVSAQRSRETTNNAGGSQSRTSSPSGGTPTPDRPVEPSPAPPSNDQPNNPPPPAQSPLLAVDIGLSGRITV